MSLIALLSSRIPERPVGIEKIIYESRRDDADGLVILWRDIGEEYAQQDENQVTDRQGDKGDEIELETFDMKLVPDISAGERPGVIEYEIGQDRYLDRDRGRDVFIQPVINQQRENPQIDEHPAEAHDTEFYECLAVLEPDPPGVDHELQDVGQTQFRLASCPVDELDGDLPDDGPPGNGLVQQGNLECISLDIQSRQIDFFQ